MALDPQVKGMMERARASGRKSICTMSPPDARVAYEERYLALAPPRIEVARVEDRQLPGGAGPIRARIYNPAPAGARELPILIYFHGGGFVVGSIEAYDTQSRAIATASECVVVTPEYRLAPEHRFPAAVEDAVAITRHVADNARALGADPVRLAVGGDSAGGNLSAVVCQLAKTAGGPRIAFQLLLYPSLDYRPPEAGARYESVELFSEGYFLDRVMRDWFRGLYFTDTAESHDLRASPILAEDLSGLPPALIVTAGCDPLRDIGKTYAERLQAAGVAAEYRCYEGMIHNFFCQAGAFDVPRRALQETCAALRLALAPPA
jgi:acetyl esterase